jgi:hypothetical protein
MRPGNARHHLPDAQGWAEAGFIRMVHGDLKYLIKTLN